MRVSGITIAYRALANGYPAAESVRSMAPLCDEIVANVGGSDDGTMEAVREAGAGKVRLIEEPWDMSLREKGLLLSRETNRALDAATGDWVVYLQADEVLHEDDLGPLRAEIERAHAMRTVDGLALRYLHFYGDPWHVQDNPFRWYRRAVRVLRRDPAIRSVGDALKFRRIGGRIARRLCVKASRAHVYHYGWARPPGVMVRKQRHLDRFWHSDEEIERAYARVDAGNIYRDVGHLVRFTGTHPSVMAERIRSATWAFNSPPSRLPRWIRLGLLLVAHPLARLRDRLLGRRGWPGV